MKSAKVASCNRPAATTSQVAEDSETDKRESVHLQWKREDNIYEAVNVANHRRLQYRDKLSCSLSVARMTHTDALLLAYLPMRKVCDQSQSEKIPKVCRKLLQEKTIAPSEIVHSERDRHECSLMCAANYSKNVLMLAAVNGRHTSCGEG